jgi:hypothetical protein
MRRFITLFLVAFLIASVSSCFATPTEKEWTILVYSVTDRMLVETVIADLNEMEFTGSSKNMEILVQLDQNDQNAVRYQILKDDNPDKLASPIVQSLGNVDCGSWKTLYDFVKWGTKRAPSRRVMLILQGCLGNLGYGEPIKQMYRGASLKELLYQGNFDDTFVKAKLDKAKLQRDYKKAKENGARYMGIRQMGFALRAIKELLGKKIEIIGLDDSCECSIEKFFEFKEHAKTWIGSVGFLPSDNWPYRKIIGSLDLQPNMSEEDFGKIAVEAFKDHYKPYCSLPYGFGATLTAFSLNKTEKLATELKNLSEKLYSLARKRENRTKILSLRKKILSYISSDEVDLLQLMKGLPIIHLTDSSINPICKKIEGLIPYIPIAHWADGRIYKPASGISISVTDFLFGYDKEKYNLLKWSGYSRWNKFLIRLGKDF